MRRWTIGVCAGTYTGMHIVRRARSECGFRELFDGRAARPGPRRSIVWPLIATVAHTVIPCLRCLDKRLLRPHCIVDIVVQGRVVEDGFNWARFCGRQRFDISVRRRR